MTDDRQRGFPSRVLLVIGPGLLMAATGVGAGDLASASFASIQLGTAILWAVVVGAFMKYVVTEGLARWQLATGETLLEGAIGRLGLFVSVPFVVYLLPWSFFVGAALISACGVTGYALLAPLGLFESPDTAKLVLGAAHSVVGVVLVWFGGFKLIERVMAACIAVMFVTVLVTAVLVATDPAEIATGLVIPRIPQFDDGGLAWTIALIGGVGGTLTVLCYGYWIREIGRERPEALRTCRIDLAGGYTMTAVFGIAMVIIASGLDATGKGVGLIVALADQLERELGVFGRWFFLVGAWGAIFSSLLGVWQAVPYVFADFVRQHTKERGSRAPVDTRRWAYRGFMLAIATVPLLQVHRPFSEVQKYYAVIGAVFIPLLAIMLLGLNSGRHVGVRLRNKPATIVMLMVIVLLFVMAGVMQVRAMW